jgi:hypothetical protein
VPFAVIPVVVDLVVTVVTVICYGTFILIVRYRCYDIRLLVTVVTFCVVVVDRRC